jgi:hypothetical protein
MAQAQSQFPWSEPLFPIFNELVQKGSNLVDEERKKNPDAFASDRFFIPFENLSQLLSESASSEHELSLRAFAYAGTSLNDFTNDEGLCNFFGTELDQCNKGEGEDAFMLTINDEPFYKTTENDTEVQICIKLFTTLKQNRKDLTSTQFLYILIGMQQKNSSVLLSALKRYACDAVVKKIEIDKRETVIGILQNYIPINPSKIEINIALDYESKDVLIFFKNSIPIEIASYTDRKKREVYFIENFIFLVDVTETFPHDAYYKINKQAVKYLTDLLKFYYTFLYNFLSTKGGIMPGLEFRDDFFHDLKLEMIREKNEQQRIANRTAIEVESDAANADARAATAASKARAATDAALARDKAERVQQHLARLFGGKRKKASNLRSSKQRYSLKNKSRRNRNKSRRKNKLRRNKSFKN